jgi:hypothetical protein
MIARAFAMVTSAYSRIARLSSTSARDRSRVAECVARSSSLDIGTPNHLIVNQVLR